MFKLFIMTVTDKIQKAKIQLILTQPFFATLLLSLPIVEDSTIKKAATDGSSIKYNPEYINGLQTEEVKGLLCSGIMKIANFHHLRRNGRDQTAWNKASDYAVNALVKNSGLSLPADSLISDEYKDLAAEQIFKLIPIPPPQDKPGKGQQNDTGEPQPGNSDSGPMEVQDAPQKTEGEKQEQEAKIKQKMAQAVQIAKRASGSQGLPGELLRMVEDILQPKINWKETLARFVMETSRNDYSFKKPNPRFIQSGFYLPSLYNEEPGNIIFIVDTSASIDDDLFKEIGTEVKDAASTLQAGLKVIYVDSKVQGVQDIEPDEDIKLEAVGGGSTKFSPGFNYIDENGLTPKAVIYLTDGESHDFPEQEPDYPTLWIKYGHYNFKPPFGETIAV